MDRRHYIALLAAVGTAGCNTDNEPGDGTATPTETPTETDAETPADTPTETNTETATETETETETEEPLSEEEQQAETRLQEANDHIGKALDRYAAGGDAETVLGVRASGGRFDWPPIERAAEEAKEPIEKAKELGNQQQRDRADALSRIRKFIVDAARAQSSLGEAFPRFVRMHDGYINEEFGDVTGERDQFSTSVSSADERLESAMDRFQPEDADVCESLPRETYTAKADQLRAERDALLAFSKTEEGMTVGMRSFRDGVDRYLRERWTPAMDDFQTTTDRLTPSVERMNRDDVGDEPFDKRYNALASLASALAAGSEHLIESARAYRGGNRSEGNDRLEDAQDALDGSRAARRDHESAREILDFEGR